MIASVSLIPPMLSFGHRIYVSVPSLAWAVVLHKAVAPHFSLKTTVSFLSMPVIGSGTVTLIVYLKHIWWCASSHYSLKLHSSPSFPLFFDVVHVALFCKNIFPSTFGPPVSGIYDLLKSSQIGYSTQRYYSFAGWPYSFIGPSHLNL